MAAENCDIKPGDTVAVWGCGPVGQFAIQSARLLGATRVIAIDGEPARLRMAETCGHAQTLISGKDVPLKLKEMTGASVRTPVSTPSVAKLMFASTKHDTTNPNAHGILPRRIRTS